MSNETIQAAAPSPMAKYTLVYGVLLVLLGVVMYGIAAAGVVSGATASRTALFPSVFGIPFLALGAVALGAKPGVRKHLMHAAAALALLLVLMGLGMAAAALARAGFDPGELKRPLATLAQAIMGALSAGFVAVCVKSFIAARRSRA